MLIHLVPITETISIGVGGERVAPELNLDSIIKPISVSVPRGGIGAGLELAGIGQSILVRIACAEDLEVAQLASNGRLLVGLGAGYRPAEFEMFG